MLIKRGLFSLTLALAVVLAAAPSPARAEAPEPVPPGAAAVVAAYQKLKFLGVLHDQTGEDWVFEGESGPVKATVHCPAGTTPAQFRDYWLKAVRPVAVQSDPAVASQASPEATPATAAPYASTYAAPTPAPYRESVSGGDVSGGRTHYVHGYTRKDGTVVRGYYRR